MLDKAFGCMLIYCVMLHCIVWTFVDMQTDTHYAILSLLLLLANSPTKAEFQQSTADKFPGVISDEQKLILYH